ncbi:sugar ABC transporter ATP-binding protein [Micromonospora yasonensis]|uniref:sugar ABC transporter ATP-binding protein n=1 Tax=Micromonospora yasonensis TaxID=1128667 RepID=UPI00222E0E56|nr:sugar ABC transporter ATP-binding protein [Micromonospora yasonensis]MCW3840774.1 sugar ABC transporter ATP-binding protein [Micromonospora yasonensis]
MAGSSTVIEAAGVVRDFPGTRALDHVSFTLRRGEVHALLGENGAGKSTLVKVLCGIDRPDAGVLRLHGTPVRFSSPRDAERAGIGAVHQEANLVPQMSVARNLFLGREPRHRLGLINVARMNTGARDIMADCGLRIDVRQPLESFDAGIQQLVAVARAVATGTSVIVLDEPTAGLDDDQVERLLSMLDTLRDQGRSIVYVSHRLTEIERICDRATVLRDGRLVHTGPLAGLDRMRLVSLMLGRRVALGTAAPGGASAVEPADPPILQATGLTRRHVLGGVSINLRPGEVVGLSGLLGAGRSETAKAIAGAMPLDAGQVTVSGAHLRQRSIAGAVRAGVGLLPQNRTTEGIIASLSVRDNIALAALPRLSRAGIVSEARLDRIVETFMRRLRIKANSPHQPVGELSGGNQQKVLLARWLATHPRVLMLDEPTRGIDIGTKSEVQALIDDLAVDGLAVMLISSDLEELVGSCDRVLVLRDGAVAGQLTGPNVTEKNIMALLAAT